MGVERVSRQLAYRCALAIEDRHSGWPLNSVVIVKQNNGPVRESSFRGRNGVGYMFILNARGDDHLSSSKLAEMVLSGYVDVSRIVRLGPLASKGCFRWNLAVL
jgi:hypothetical protein